MKLKWQVVIALTVFIVGSSGLFLYDRWIVPNVFSEKVVRVKSPKEGLPSNYVLQEKDVYLDGIEKSALPKDVITDVSAVIGKRTSITLTDGTVLTKPLIDVDDLQPGPDEGIFPIPKDAIYAINGSLRARDKVSIFLVAVKDQNTENDIPSLQDAFIESCKVAFVRTEENNDVKDTEDGNSNRRVTSTGKVAYPEVLLTLKTGEDLKNKLEQGYKLWVVRIE